jgi:hypothetical protein
MFSLFASLEKAPVYFDKSFVANPWVKLKISPMLLTAAEPDLHYCVSKEEMLF